MFGVFSGALFRQYAVVFALNLNCLSFGLGTNWPSPVLVKLTNASETVLSRPLEQAEISWIVSVSYLSGGIGYVITIALVDIVGRKHCVVMSSLFKMASALLFLFANDVWMLILGRSINGLTEGIILAVVPVYSSEIACKEVRGALGVMLQIFASIGTVIMLSIGPFISYFYLNLMLTVSILLTSIPTVFLPDSPSFLYSRGRYEESKNILIFLRGSELQANEELKEYSNNKNDEKLSLMDTFQNTIFLKGLWRTGFVTVLVYLVGFNCVITYLQTILNTTQTSVRSEVASGIIGGMQLLASFMTMLVTDRFGRKPIMVSTLLGLATGLVGLGTFFKLAVKGTEISGFMNYLPLISLIIIVLCYSAGPGSLMWVVIAEHFEDRCRGVGVATSLLIGMAPAFLTVRYFSPLVHTIGEAPTFWIFASLSVVLAVFILYKVPETKGKSFAEIQEELGNTILSLSDPSVKSIVI